MKAYLNALELDHHFYRGVRVGGLTPGDAYPVFETDFGRVGLMICWDVQFPEPARALAEATPERPVAVAELHLDRKIVQPWLGDMKTRTWKERRPDIPVE